MYVYSYGMFSKYIIMIVTRVGTCFLQLTIKKIVCFLFKTIVVCLGGEPFRVGARLIRVNWSFGSGKRVVNFQLAK